MVNALRGRLVAHARLTTLLAILLALVLIGAGIAVAVLGSPDATLRIADGATTVGQPSTTIDSNVTDAVEMRLVPALRQIAPGGQFAVAIASDGTLWGWGRNQFSQAAGPFCGQTATPVRISSATDWKYVAAGSGFGLAIKNDDTLWCWGGLTGVPVYSVTPVQVGTSTWKDVAGGTWHTIAVRSDGTLWACGYNGSGQLGNGTNTDLSTLTQIGTASDWAKVWAAGQCSWAIKTDGSLWAWGYNTYADLGIGTSTNVNVPTRVGTANDWASVTNGFALKTDGSLWGWGQNGAGQLGVSTGGATALSPIRIGTDADWAEVSGGVSVLARKTDGSLWTWGLNSNGACGLGTKVVVTAPTRIGTDTGWTDVASSVSSLGGSSGYGIRGENLYDAGSNYNGQLGNSSSVTEQLTWTQVGMWEPYAASRAWTVFPEPGYTTGTSGLFVTYRDASGNKLVLSDTVNFDFQSPSGSMSINSNAAATRSRSVTINSSMSYANDMRIDGGAWIPYAATVPATLTAGDGIKTVVVDYRYAVNGNITTKTDTIELDTTPPTGTISIDGGADVTRYSRVSVTSSVVGAVGMSSRTTTWTAVAFGYNAGGGTTLAIRSDGSLWGWGLGGLLGLGSTAQQNTPTEILPGTSWKCISTTDHVVAIRTDGSLWVWGANTYGQYGDGTTRVRTGPQRAGSSQWRTVAAGNGYTVGIRADGSLWAWGKNDLGQLGDGTIVNKLSPVRIGTASDWATVISNNGSNLALKTDGSLYAWGYNGSGQLGDGSTTNRTAPVRIGTANDWAKIAIGSDSALALKADGTLWAWGSNSSGDFGDGTTTSSNAPVRVGLATDWADVSIGGLTGFGVKRDGTLYAWGYNASYQVGDGTTTNRPSPQVVPGLGPVAQVFGTNNNTFVVDAAGLLWGWGYNGWGELANPNRPGSSYASGPERAGWAPYAATFIDRLPPGDGVRTAQMEFLDGAGNTAVITDSITVDSARPAGTFQIAAGAAYVQTNTVTVNSDVPGAVTMRVGQRPIALGAGWGDQYNGAPQGLAMLLDDGPLMRLVPEASFTAITQPDTRWKQADIGAGFQALLAEDGSVWTFGSNYRGGSLGTGDTLDRAVPTPVYGSRQYSKIAAGQLHTIALTPDGRAYGWGWCTEGQVGVGWITGYYDAQQIVSPTEVYGYYTDWTDISAGEKWSVGVRSDGQVWMWGLQPGTASKLSRPTRLGTETGAAKVFAGQDHGLVIKTDGSLWSWGANAAGQLGDGTTVAKSGNLVSVDNGEWRTAAAGAGFSVALRSDGTLWSWGGNGYGQLGKGDTANSSIPVRVGADTDWDTLEAGGTWVIATKKDGSVWAWGRLNGKTTPTEIAMRPSIPYASVATASIPWAQTTVNIWASFTDRVGNVNWLSDSIAFDLAEPHTTLSGITSAWAATPATFQLSATDIASGVDTVYYAFDGGEPQIYEGPVTITKQGLTTLEYWATDLSGRVEARHSALVRIDTVVSGTMPTLACATCHPGFPAAHPMSNCVACHYGDFGHTSLGQDKAPVGYCWSSTGLCHVTAPTYPVHGVEAFVPPNNYYKTTYDCTYCHATRFPGVRSHAEDDLNHVSQTSTEECRPCHSRVLTREHSRYVDDTAASLTCMTCHDPAARSGVPEAIAAKDTRCDACHTTYADSHNALHGTVPLDTVCLGCHKDNLVTEHVTNRGLGCSACHMSADPTVLAAISANSLACSSCHTAGHPHPAAQITRVLANGEKECTACHSTDIVVEHSKVTSQRNGSTCDTCHAAGGPRDQISGAWDRTCTTAACHAPGSSRAVHENYCLACHATTQPDFATSKTDFSTLPPVNRETACKSCHLLGLVGTHPYHQTGANCGAACHPGWGTSLMSATPAYTDPSSGASFATSLSKITSPALLHVIHASPRWPANAAVMMPDGFQRNTCGSCHATAACNACHTGAVPARHATHSSAGGAGLAAFTPWVGKLSRGVTNNDMTQANGVVESNQCASISCHNVAASATRMPASIEDYNYTVGVNPDDPTGTSSAISLVGTWRYRASLRYSGGRMSYNNVAGSSLSVAFSGTRVDVISEKDPYRGIAEVLVDGAVVGTFDAYSAVSKAQTVVFTANVSAGSHTLTVRPLGTKSASARGTYVVVDQFRVYGTIPDSIAPTCSSCHTDRVANHW